uniref:Uncharacterized protein n=1 Tax=Eutreptiella gymnastica TaxID=73025 RepID=A0A7S1J316_9EUGL
MHVFGFLLLLLAVPGLQGFKTSSAFLGHAHVPDMKSIVAKWRVEHAAVQNKWHTLTNTWANLRHMEHSKFIPTADSCESLLPELVALDSDADCQSLAALFEPGASITQEVTASVCGGACMNKLTPMMAKVGGCTGAMSTELKEAAAVVALVCTKDAAGQYCLPKYSGLLTGNTSALEVSKEDAAMTATDMERMCSPCASIMGRFLMLDSVSGEESAGKMDAEDIMGKSLGIMCVKVGTTWCMPEITQLGDFNLEELVWNASLVCKNKCVRTVLTKTIALMAEMAGDGDGLGTAMAQIETMNAYLCAQNSNGSYCSDLLSAGMKADNPPCTVLSDGGCCTGVAHKLLVAEANLGPRIDKDYQSTLGDENPLSLFQNLTKACNYTVPEPCSVTPAGESKSVTFTADMAWSYVSANKATFITAIKKDIAFALSIPEKFIIEVLVAQAGGSGTSSPAPTTSSPAQGSSKMRVLSVGGTEVTAKIQTDGTARTDELIQELQAASESGQLSLPSTEKVYTSKTGMKMTIGKVMLMGAPDAKPGPSDLVLTNPGPGLVSTSAGNIGQPLHWVWGILSIMSIALWM